MSIELDVGNILFPTVVRLLELKFTSPHLLWNNGLEALR
jgi:hypothetical protein